VRILSDKTDPATIRALTTIGGGEIIDQRKLLAPAGLRPVGPAQLPTLHLFRDGKKVSALIE
jgi:hypothetical protein